MSDSKSLFLLTVAITLFGLVMVGSASVVDAARSFGDKWYYLKLQSIWAALGFVSLIFFSRFNHLKLQKYAFIFYVVSIVLLVLVLIPGIGTKLLGARRWINLGFQTIQPSEISKILTAVYFSSLLAKPGRHLQFLMTILLASGLIILEPDLGTALVIISMGIVLYFGSGGKISHLLLIGIAGVLAVSLIIMVSPYRMNRLKSFMDVSHDPLGASYQIRQALVALGSGGILGEGLGQSRQKYNFLPESTTDSIFAIVGEELGLVGGVAVLSAYLLFALKGLKIVSKCQNKFSANLALALVTVVVFQAFINISAITAMAPLTGIPLTFISYGGSSLLIMLSATGVLINIAKAHE